LVESAMLNKPQFVTKHGHNAVVVLSFEDYKKITKPKIDLVAFLKNSPLAEIELDILRNGELPRDIDL
jgi:prevent-host-death family protein